MKNILLITILIFSFTLTFAQDKEKKSRKEKRQEREAKQMEETKRMVDEKAYVFVPTQVLPTGMRSVTVDASFEAKIENDSIICYLPFMGRAYSASYGGTDSPMDFSQPITKYTTENNKKGGWMVKFDVRNKNDLLNFTFQIGETGTTSLSVNSSNRAFISYYGDIVKIKKDKE